MCSVAWQLSVLQIVFTLRAMQHPASMPMSLASLYLIEEATNTFMGNIWELLTSAKSVSEQLSSVRKLYEVHNIVNKVPDGTIPFPEDASKIRFGIELEFRCVIGAYMHSWARLTSMAIRNVTFKYPGAANYALQNISFKLVEGQLCVRFTSLFKYAWTCS